MNLDKHQRWQYQLEDFYVPELDETEDFLQKFAEPVRKTCRGELKQIDFDLFD